MEMTFGVWALIIGVVCGAAYLLRTVLRGGRSGDPEGGAVSQSWLTEHNSGKGDRFL
jgi:hypothetical protein